MSPSPERSFGLMGEGSGGENGNASLDVTLVLLLKLLELVEEVGRSLEILREDVF